MIANRIAYGETLIELAAENPGLVVLDADASKSTGTLQFLEKVPDRFFQCGIAEQNMMGIAAGLASCGKTAFVATFAVFTCMRAVEQVRNTICYSNLNVKVAGTHAGLETGGDGGTHQAIEDLSIMRAIPNITVIVPSTPYATRKLTRIAAETYGPFYIRMGKDPAPELYQGNEDFRLGGSHELASGNDVAIMACGNMVSRALDAAAALKNEGIQARVVDLYSIKPIDKDAIIRAARETRGIVTIEDHSIVGGLGGAVAEVLAENSPARMKRIGLEDVFGRSGDPAALYEMFGLTPERVVAAVHSLLEDGK